jgi:hypothetical protein
MTTLQQPGLPVPARFKGYTLQHLGSRPIAVLHSCIEILHGALHQEAAVENLLPGGGCAPLP